MKKNEVYSLFYDLLIYAVILVAFFHFRIETIFWTEDWEAGYLEFQERANFWIPAIAICVFIYFLKFVVFPIFVEWGTEKDIAWIKKYYKNEHTMTFVWTRFLLNMCFWGGIYYYFANLPDAVVVENGQERFLCEELKAVDLNKEQCKQCLNREFKNGNCFLLKMKSN